MKLYLVQHGKAHSKDENPERPLTDAGVADIERLAVFMNRADIRVERVIHSGKLRARQTAKILAAAIAPEVRLDTSGLMNPNDNPGAFDWQSESWDRDTLIVGHLPFMAKLVSHLLIDDSERPVTAYKPGSVVCLEHDSDGHWSINWMIRPELLE